MVLHLAIRIAYDGTRFQNYARDPGAPESVEAALMQALRHEGLVDGSFSTGSRTDRGVSALENVVRVDLDRPHLKGLLPAVQARLPAGLWITGAAPVAADWNPRPAASRTYRYRIARRDEDPHRLALACAAFVGKHNMSAFAKVEEGRDPVRDIQAFSVEAENGFWVFTVRSPGFLWNQVRRMVDAALAVGRGDCMVEDVKAALAHQRTHTSWGVAAPEGLMLASVRYAPPLEWADAGKLSRGRIARERVHARVMQDLTDHAWSFAE